MGTILSILKNRLLNIKIALIVVLCTTSNIIANNVSNGTIYMNRDFAMSFCEPYITADSGNLKLNLTAEEATAMGINPNDYAEIVRNISVVNDSLAKEGSPIHIGDIRFVKDNYYWEIAQSFKKEEQPNLTQEAAFCVMNRFSTVENGRYVPGITANEAANKGISGNDYAEYCRQLEASNRHNAETGRLADQKFPFMAHTVRMFVVQPGVSVSTLPQYEGIHNMPQCQGEKTVVIKHIGILPRHSDACDAQPDTCYHMKETSFAIGMKYMTQDGNKVVLAMTPEQAEQLRIAPEHYAIMQENVQNANIAMTQWGGTIDIAPMISDTAKLDANINRALELERFIRKEKHTYMPDNEAVAFIQSKIQTVDGKQAISLTLEEAHNQGVSPFVYEQISRMIKSMNENRPDAGVPQIMKLNNEPAS